MNILFFNPENLILEPIKGHKLIQLQSNSMNEVINQIKHYNASAIIINCLTDSGRDLISKIKIVNDLFPCFGIIQYPDPIFPENTNAFHCFNLEELNTEHVHKNIISFSQKYQKKKKEIEQIINQAKDPKDIAEHQKLTDADRLMLKYNWGDYLIPNRKNPVLETLDKLVNVSQQLLDSLEKQPKKNQ